MSELTAEDYASIDRAARELHARGWRTVFTLDEMFRAWDHFVGEVEGGYDQTVDEYTNDIYCRNWIALAWPMLTARVRGGRLAELEALDMRFRTATVDDGGVAIGRFHRVSDDDGWWWRRRPIKVAGEFATDLGLD